LVGIRVLGGDGLIREIDRLVELEGAHFRLDSREGGGRGRGVDSGEGEQTDDEWFHDGFHFRLLDFRVGYGSESLTREVKNP
jgi:hypothetical protein